MDVFGNIEPISVMSDYEDSLRAAVRETWPAASIRGCWFHFAQAVLRMAVKLKVARSDMASVIHMAMTLPLLPKANVAEGFEFIRRKVVGANGKEFADYLSRQWANKDVSVFGLTVRTNNQVESFHRNLMRVMRVPHPGVWTFIDHLRRINFNKSLDLDCLEIHTTTAPPQRTAERIKNAKIEEAQRRFGIDSSVEGLLETLKSIMGTVYRRCVRSPASGSVEFVESAIYAGNELDTDSETEIEVR